MTSKIKIIVLGLIAFYLLGCIALTVFERKLMYFPPPDYYTPEQIGTPQFTEQIFDVQDKSFSRLTGWYSPAKPGEPTVLYTHGNGTAVWGVAPLLGFLTDQGYGVLIVGYPGYPGGDGKPSQAGFIDAALLHYDWLIGQGVRADDIILYGTSIGTGVASQILSARPARQIILEAPFKSTMDEARRFTKVVPVGFLMKDQFRSDLALADAKVPLAWFHGDKDIVVSIDGGEALYALYPGPKTKLRISGGRHNDLLDKGGREFVLKSIRDYTAP